MTSKEQTYAICVAVGSSCIAAALCELALLMIVAMIRSRTIALQLHFWWTFWEEQTAQSGKESVQAKVAAAAGVSQETGKSEAENGKRKCKWKEQGTNEVCTREALANQALHSVAVSLLLLFSSFSSTSRSHFFLFRFLRLCFCLRLCL